MSNQVENTLIEINSLSGWARRLRRRPTGSKKARRGEPSGFASWVYGGGRPPKRPLQWRQGAAMREPRP